MNNKSIATLIQDLDRSRDYAWSSLDCMDTLKAASKSRMKLWDTAASLLYLLDEHSEFVDALKEKRDAEKQVELFEELREQLAENIEYINSSRFSLSTCPHQSPSHADFLLQVNEAFRVTISHILPESIGTLNEINRSASVARKTIQSCRARLEKGGFRVD